MSATDLVTTQGVAPSPAPFGQQGRGLALAAQSINSGAVAVEQERAIAEAQGQLTLAKRFPRDINAAHAELMVACKSKAFAAVAFYAKPQGGGTVSGPSIRMAEQIVQVYGNFQYGHRELSRDAKKSEVEVFAWDMEKNNYAKRQITVMHVRDTREGPKPLRDQSDVDMKINNVASKQARGLILAMMPKWLVEDAVNECRKTIAGNNDEPMEVRVRKMVQAFSKYGVTGEHLEKHLGHKLDKVLLDELVDLQGIFNSLKDGTPASELFPDDQPATDTTAAKPEPSGGAETARQSGVAREPAPSKRTKSEQQPAAQKQETQQVAASAAQTESKTAQKVVNSEAEMPKEDTAQPPGAANDSSNSQTQDDGDFF